MGRFTLFAFAALAALALVPCEAQEARFFAIGTDATLLCNWEGAGLTNPNDIKLVKWVRKGNRLRGNRYVFGSSGFNHTVTIKNVRKEDKGTYYCSPKAKGGATLADGQFVVTVGKAKLPVAGDPKDVMVSESGSTQLSCNYADAKERYNLKLYWGFNDNKFKEESGRVSEDSETTYNTYTDDNGVDWMQISTMDLNAAGEYSCNYRYPDKQVFTMAFNVQVEKIVGPDDVERNMTMKEDHKMGTLICDLSSLQESTVEGFHWEKDGEELMNKEGKYVISVNGTVRRIQIHNLNKENDEGVYRCVAQLKYFPVAVRFNVEIEESRMDTDFTQWTEWSVCDRQNRRFRFRTCTDPGCLDRYGYVYNVRNENCTEPTEPPTQMDTTTTSLVA